MESEERSSIMKVVLIENNDNDRLLLKSLLEGCPDVEIVAYFMLPVASNENDTETFLRLRHKG